MCSRASRSSNDRQLQIGSGVLRCSAFRCLPSCTHTQLSPGLISSIKLASQAECEAKRPCTNWHGTSPHFSALAPNLFPSLFCLWPSFYVLYLYAIRFFFTFHIHNICHICNRFVYYIHHSRSSPFKINGQLEK